MGWLNLLRSSILPPPTAKYRVVKFQEISRFEIDDIIEMALCVIALGEIVLFCFSFISVLFQM